MAESKRRFSLTVLAGDGALLLCALWGLTGAFLSLYGGRQAAPWADTTVLVRCAVDEDLFFTWAALFGLLSLAVWSLPRVWGAAAGGLAAVWVLALWRGWKAVFSGAGVTVKIIADLFAARVEWGRTFPYDVGTGLNQVTADARLFLLFAIALLALILGWAVVRARRWWLVLALTLPPLLPGLLADFYPDWPPFLALCACWCAMVLTDLCRWAASDSRGKLTLIVLPAVAAALAFITVLFPQEGYVRPPWALAAEEQLLNLTSRAADWFSQWDGSFGGGPAVTYVGSAGEADLAHAGPLKHFGRTVLRLTSDYDGRLYLRGSSLAVYEGGVWKPLPEGTYDEYGGGVVPLYFPAIGGGGGDSRAYTAAVSNVGAVGSCVYVPYYPVVHDVDESGILPVEDSYFAYRRGRRNHTVSFVERQPQGWDDGPVHAVAGVGNGPARTDVGTDREAYARYVRSHYLDVPEELREELEGLCWRMNALGTPPEPGGIQAVWQAERVAAYLDTLCEYDPDTPAAPEGADPVLYFLNESHRGYCMHYASAATLLLRAMGVPARYAGGFTAQAVPGRTVDIPDRAAHAWVEVWIDGFGWYPVEVTPATAFTWYERGDEPSQLPSDPAAESATPPPTPTPTPAPTTDAPGPADGLSPGGSAPTRPGAEDGPSPLGGWLRGGLLAAGLAALVWLGQLVPKRVRAGRMSGLDPNRAALACYHDLRRMERWGGHTAPRALELAEKAKFSGRALAPEEVDELRVLVDWERTRLCAVLPPVKRMLFRYCWGTPSSRKKRENPEKSTGDGD